MFIAWIRNRLGWTLFIGGYLILAYEIYLWWNSGFWNQFPISLVVEWSIHTSADVAEYVPFIHPDGVEMLRLFLVSDLPFYAARFFKVIPTSGFILVLGYFFIRWEKYFGKK